MCPVSTLLLLSSLSFNSNKTVAMDHPASSAFIPELPSAPETTLFYDPIDDEHNMEWAFMQRQGCKSDVVLSCHACFTILCIDCQRHEFYVD